MEHNSHASYRDELASFISHRKKKLARNKRYQMMMISYELLMKQVKL